MLNPRGFSLQEAELEKFTNLGLVGVTGHSIPKMEISYDGNGNPTTIDMFSGAANRLNVRIPGNLENLVALAGAYWTFEDVSGVNKYYVWYFIDGSGVDPSLAGRTGIQVTSPSVASSVSAATVSAVNSSPAATYVRAIPLDANNVSVYHTEHGAVVQPESFSSNVVLTTLTQGKNFVLASRSQISYDVNSNPVKILRVEF